MKKTENGFSLVGLAIKLILICALFIVSCKTQEEISSEEEKTYMLIEGNHVEMVADEFGNQYLKQYFGASNAPIYIPFTFETEEESDSLHSLQAKIPTDDDPRRF
jgi:hypothetical protein